MEPQKDPKAMAPSFTPKNVKDLRPGDKVKVSGTETYAVLTGTTRSADGRGVVLQFDGLAVTRSLHATVKVLNQQ